MTIPNSLQGDKSQADEARISINHLLKGVQ